MNKLQELCSSKRGKWVGIGVGLASLLAITSLAGAASTSSLFSDTHNSDIVGGVGNVHISVANGAGGSADTLSLGNNMLPGEASSVTETYQNTGSGKEDVYLTFPNATALSALNSLGSYGEVHIKANGHQIFDSANLKDTAASCGDFSPSGCWPLLKQYKLGSINAGDTGSFTFEFNYAAKLSGQGPAGVTVPWNTFPIAAGLWSPSNTNGQTYINASDGTGSGLPVALVATQVGQLPA